MVQTTGSAGESIAAGIVFTLPAILLLGYDLTVGKVAIVAVVGGFVLMAALVTWLGAGLGVPWSLAMLLTAALSAIAAAIGVRTAMRYFEHTRLKASRRQLARLGFGELAALMPDADSSVSAEDAADSVHDATADKPVKKGLGVDVTPP